MPIHPLLKAVIIGVISSALVIPFTFTELYSALELRFYDLRLRLRPQRPVSDKIIVIAIDDKSIKAVGRWPWTRDKHSAMIDTLSSLGARSIVFDVEFLEESPSTIEKDIVEYKLMEVGKRLVELSHDLKSLSDSEATAKEGEVFSAQQLLDYYSDILQEEGDTIKHDIDEIILDHDKKLVESIALSNRTILAFHPVELLPASGNLSSRYPAIKELIIQGQAERPEDLARRLSLDKKQQRELIKALPLIKMQVALEVFSEALKRDPQATKESTLQNLARMTLDEDIRDEAYNRARLMYYVGDRFGRNIRVVTSGDGAGEVPSFPLLEVPIYPLLEVSKDIGHTAITRDPEDGVVRKVPLVVKRGDKYFLQLALLAVCDNLGVRDEDMTLYPGKYLSIKKPSGTGEIRVPVDTTGHALINFSGPSGRLSWKKTFSALSSLSVIDLWRARKDSDALWEALDGKYLGGAIKGLENTLSKTDSPAAKRDLERQIERKREELIDFIQLSIEKSESMIERETDGERRNTLNASLEQMRQELYLLKRLDALERKLSGKLKGKVEGKICVVGAMFTGGTDFNPTPQDPACPGTVLNGHIINMLLQERFVKYDSQMVNIITLMLLGLSISVIAMAVGSLIGGGALAGIIALYLFVSYLLLAYLGIWIHVVGPLIAMIVSYTSVTVYLQLTDERKRRETKRLFQHYLHPTVVEELTRDPRKLKLGGQKKELTIQFSDIRGFTTFSEYMKPEELEQFLNLYLSAMTDVILKHGGTIDKYEGDAIMAFYGAPVDQPDHALRACRAALESLEVLKGLNRTVKERGWPFLKIGIGINTGAVVVGNMGTKTRFDYTVIGDAVNLTSRLESANKTLETTILAGQDTYELVKDELFAIYLGDIRVKGKVRPAGIYNLVSTKENATPEDKELDRLLSAGISLYKERDWKGAMEYFARVLSLRPSFHVAEIYSKNCRVFMDDPPEPGWAGYISLEIK